MTPELSYSEHLCVHCRKCEQVCKSGVHVIREGKRELRREACIRCGACGETCPTGALALLGRDWSVDEILEEVLLDRLFYGAEGGVTVSGGEPFRQPEALLDLLKALKREGINTCVETCGFASPEAILQASRYTDTFLFDYKETDPALHQRFTGVDPVPILKNLEVLDTARARVILRCPIIPDCNLREEHMLGIAEVAKRHPCIEQVELMPYHPLGLGKAMQIGASSDYANSDFLDRETLRDNAAWIERLSGKPIKIN